MICVPKTQQVNMWVALLKSPQLKIACVLYIFSG